MLTHIDLREAILSLADDDADVGPFALWTGVETLLARRAKEEEEARRRRRSKERGDSAPWWRDIVAGFGGFGLLPSRPSSPISAAAAPIQEDPVLTRHDLFHSPSYDAALIEHFASLFPPALIRRPRIERVVRQQGGSYASLRQRLEAMVLEAGGGGGGDDADGGEWGRGARGGGGGVAAVAKWWKRLTRIEAQEARVALPRASPPPQQQGQSGSTRRHPFLEREIEAFERRARQAPGASPRLSAGTPSLAIDGDDENNTAADDHFECQCCFSSSEPSSPETRFSCDHTDDNDNNTKHSFCRTCVRSLAQNYAFGETPLSTVSLERFVLPCMAATTSDQPCLGMIGRDELRRALDEQLLSALERRMTEAVLERFAAAAAATPRRRDGSNTTNTTLVRCPFCPYAELVDPKPGPLVETFCPAWVREPFPPSASDILRSVLGTSILLPLLAITLALLVLVTPARRLERTYERVVVNAAASSSPPDAGSTSLTLLDRLILEPQLLPTIVFAHLAELCERVRAHRHGQRTVFRCRNVGEAVQGGRRPRWEVVMRMDALDAQVLDWSKNAEEKEEEEERDPHVEMRRRERLVRFLWGDEAEDDAADSPFSSASQQQPSERTPSCGRVSCLLCQAALNPAAPSLHTCRAGSSSSSSATTTDSNVSPQERAEESLRLAVEKAMSAAVVRECERCGAGLTKKGGEGACNKVTCRCGFAYCHACLGPISSWDGYRHFCPHPRDPLHPNQCPEPGCTKCSLWIEPDLTKRRRQAADRAREQWARENPEWAEAVAKSKPLRAVGADLHLNPVYETTLDYYDRCVEWHGDAAPASPTPFQALLDARLHAHLNGSREAVDDLLLPLPHERHSARTSFSTTPLQQLSKGDTPPLPLSPAEATYCQLYPPPPHLSPVPTPPRDLSPSRPPRPRLGTGSSPIKQSVTMLLPPDQDSNGGRENGGGGGARASATRSSTQLRHIVRDELGDGGDDDLEARHDSMPTTELIGRLRVRVVEAKGLAVPEGRTCKPYVLLQYDRTDSVSREWGAPPPDATPSKDGKKGALRRKRPPSGSAGGEVTVRRVGGTTSSAGSSSSSTAPNAGADASNGPNRAIAAAFGSKRSTSGESTGNNGSAAPAVVASLKSVSVREPSPPPLLPSASQTTRPVSSDQPTGDPAEIGTPDCPIWNHTATFDVVSPGRTILVCVYDKLAPQGGDASRIHGFLGASVFEPPLLGLNEGEVVDKGADGEGLDVWVPVTSALDPTVGGEIHLRLLFEPLHSPPRLTVDDFQILRRIGQGSFGQVFRVRKRDTKRIYAMKVIRKSSLNTPEALAQVVTERTVLAKTNDCPFLVGLKFSFQSAEELFLVMDYKGGGEVFQHLQRDGGRFGEDKVRFYVAEIVLALDFLHSKNIVYRDLKPENCLLDGSGHVVLCDFGLSKVLDSADAKCRTLCGTTSFLAPEVLLDVGYSYPADWWSLGVLLFEMCFGWSPFYAESRIEEYERILQMEIKIPNKRGYGPEVKDLLLKLLERDPEKRLGAKRGAAELQGHPFFASIDWAKLAVRRVSPPFKPVTHADDDEPDYYDNGGTWCFSGDKCWQQPRGGNGTRASPMPMALAENGSDARGSSLVADGGRGSSTACRLVRNFTWVAKPSRPAAAESAALAPEKEAGARTPADSKEVRGRGDNDNNNNNNNSSTT
ncbi:hypothetical protein B0A53_05059 [Rhodotorula sp. CCFEE 5036]|nr:hypothetical protein B0A53_05059 [Rhodotorula sp. CCFEE 5036]